MSICSSVSLFICQSVNLLIHSSVNPFICPPIKLLNCTFINLFNCLSHYGLVCTTIDLFICPSSNPSICPPVKLFDCPFTHLLDIHPSLRLCVLSTPPCDCLPWSVNPSNYPAVCLSVTLNSFWLKIGTDHPYKIWAVLDHLIKKF